MVTEITQGIKVTVETEYQPAYSSPTQYHYVFTYRITIENQSENTIQLMRRHWHIFDAGFSMREVEGEGVVGQQPVIEPGQTHQFLSGWLEAIDEHSLHSPFFFDLYTKNIKPRASLGQYAHIESLRDKLVHDERYITVRDLGSKALKKSTRKISNIAR